ncbi:hypothetical protein WR25_24379 [Diploscapter pachys]|uniref:Cystatin domain-containing protein n=1 Tax=Diploscapter pachys TaxID=2018661 RepID=A0A2A2LSE3_9BILA|nr:hypothetical protein WR25_24379 [Diploscapter pachys]
MIRVLVAVAVIFVFVDSCAVQPPASETTTAPVSTTTDNNTGPGRKRRAVDAKEEAIQDKINVIVYTKRVYDDKTIESNMKIVRDAVEEQATKQGIDYKKLSMTQEVVNKGGKFAVSMTVEKKSCNDAKTFVTNSKEASADLSFVFINCGYSSFII